MSMGAGSTQHSFRAPCMLPSCRGPTTLRMPLTEGSHRQMPGEKGSAGCTEDAATGCCIVPGASRCWAQAGAGPPFAEENGVMRDRVAGCCREEGSA
jgi:hypothetical protein